MRAKYIIGITFDGGFNSDGTMTYHRDCFGLRKPYLFHLPGTDGNLVDSKVLGIMFDFCNALAVGDENPIALEVIVSDEKEKLDGWIALHDIVRGNYNTLPNYWGENGHGSGSPLGINFRSLYPNFSPKYIYIKKNKNIYLRIPTDFYVIPFQYVHKH